VFDTDLGVVFFYVGTVSLLTLSVIGILFSRKLRERSESDGVSVTNGGKW